jgi:hypothetical protein
MNKYINLTNIIICIFIYIYIILYYIYIIIIYIYIIKIYNKYIIKNYLFYKFIYNLKLYFYKMYNKKYLRLVINILFKLLLTFHYIVLKMSVY